MIVVTVEATVVPLRDRARSHEEAVSLAESGFGSVLSGKSH